MVIKKKTVKSKKSAVKKTAMKKAPAKKAAGRGRPKAAVKKAAVKKAPVKKAVAKKPVKKTVKKKVTKRVTKRVAKANPSAERIKALRAELAVVKAELKESKKRGSGLSRLIDNMEDSVSKLVKKELASLEKLLKGKPKKRRARKAKS